MLIPIFFKEVGEFLSRGLCGGMALAELYFLCGEHLLVQPLGLAILAKFCIDTGQATPCGQGGGMVNPKDFFLCSEHLLAQLLGFAIFAEIVKDTG